MINNLSTIGSVLITEYIAEVLFSKEAQRIENKLLSGQYHVQTIGTPFDVCAISLTVTQSGKDYIEGAYAEDEPIKLSWYGDDYVGLVRSNPSWSFFMKGDATERLYEGKIELVIL